MKKILKLASQLELDNQKLETTKEKLAEALGNYLEFEFSILLQPSDGFVIEHDQNNVSLYKVIELLETRKTLTLEEYLQNTI